MSRRARSMGRKRLGTNLDDLWPDLRVREQLLSMNQQRRNDVHGQVHGNRPRVCLWEKPKRVLVARLPGVHDAARDATLCAGSSQRAPLRRSHDGKARACTGGPSNRAHSTNIVHHIGGLPAVLVQELEHAHRQSRGLHNPAIPQLTHRQAHEQHVSL